MPGERGETIKIPSLFLRCYEINLKKRPYWFPKATIYFPLALVMVNHLKGLSDY